MDFAPGGTIRIDNSQGDHNLEGWDKSEVEVTVIRKTRRHYDPKEADEARKRLELFAVTLDHKTASDLTISTALPHRSLKRLNRGRSNLILEYQIHVPRDCHLIVHHGMGAVVVSSVIGDVEARVGTGDIVLVLPGHDGYSIDARSKFGAVESDFGDAATRHNLLSRQLAFAPASPKHKIFLRAGIGSINVKAGGTKN